MLNAVAYESECKRRPFTPASRTLLVQIAPPAMVLILAAMYARHQSSVHGFFTTIAACLPLAMARRYEATITLPHEDEAAASGLFSHGLCAFAPSAGHFSKYLERVE